MNSWSHKRDAQASHQLLSSQQEATLIDWIDHHTQTAKPFDRHDIQSLVYELSGKIPSKGWVPWFSKCNHEVCSCRPSNLDPKHMQIFKASNIKHFFGLIKTIFDAHPNLSAKHIWNMDEKGLQLGRGCKQCRKFFRPASMKQSNFYWICSDNLELVTIIECISPSGLSIPPSFVLSAGLIPTLTDLDVEIGAVATSPNGWTDNELGTNWFQQTFIPFATSHKVSNDPIVLFLDGHDLHETDTLCKLAFDYNIYIIAFPSKCTHKLQPLVIVGCVIA
jgi:DDE superfamily endonuclease